MFLSSAVTATDVGRKRAVPDFPLSSDMHTIQRRGAVRIAVHADSPGFGMKDRAGKRSGLEIYISKLIAQSIFGGTLDDASASIDFVDVASNDRMNVCEQGGVDLVIAAFANTEKRRRRIDFTKSYFGSHMGVVTRSGETDLDLSKARIAVVDGTTSVDFVVESSFGAKMVLVGSNSDLLPAVERGDADAGIHAIALLDAQLRYDAHHLVRMPASLPFDIWAIGINKERSELKEYIDARLCELVDAGFVMSAVRDCG